MNGLKNKKREKISMKLLLSLIFLSLIFSLTPLVSSVGLGHPNQEERTVFFESGLKKNIPFYVRNVKTGTDLNMSIEGELSEYVSTTEIDENNEFFVTLQLPEDIKEPGTHKVYIQAEEIPDDMNSEGMFATVTSARVPVYIKVPYPGKYPEMELNIPDANEREDINIILSVLNMGEQKIEEAKAEINIYDMNNNKIKTLETKEKPISSTEKEKFYSEFKPDNAGQYKAIATLNYDGESRNISDTFRVGSLFVEIKDYTEQFKMGGVRPFRVKIKNQWNDNIKNVFTKIIIRDDKGEKIEEIKSPSEILKNWEEKTLTSYWDVSNVSLGDYEANITIHYRNKTTQEIYDVEVVEELDKGGGILFYSLIAVLFILLFWHFKRKSIKLKYKKQMGK